MSTENEITTVARQMTDIPLVSWAWVLFVSTLGGVVSWVQKCRAGHARWFNLVEFVGELFVCSFAGVVTFLLCRSYGVEELPAVAFSAIASHMGTRGLYVLEQFVSRKFLGQTAAPPG